MSWFHFYALHFVFCTLHCFASLRPIEELTDHVVYSEPKVRDPNSNRKVCYAKSELTNHYYPHPPPPPPPQHHHGRCGQPSPGSLTKRTLEDGAMSSRGSDRWPTSETQTQESSTSATPDVPTPPSPGLLLDATFHLSSNPDRIFYPKRFRIGNSIRQGFFRKLRWIGFFIRNSFG